MRSASKKGGSLQSRNSLRSDRLPCQPVIVPAEPQIGHRYSMYPFAISQTIIRPRHGLCCGLFLQRTAECRHTPGGLIVAADTKSFMNSAILLAGLSLSRLRRRTAFTSVKVLICPWSVYVPEQCRGDYIMPPPEILHDCQFRAIWNLRITAITRISRRLAPLYHLVNI